VATAYDSTERTITISGETKPIGEVAQQQARALVSANASNSQGMATFMKKCSTELGAAVPELASQGKQGQLMSPPGSKSASVCQRSVSEAVNGKGSGPVLAALAAVFIVQRFLEQAGANSIELLRLNNHDPVSFAITSAQVRCATVKTPKSPIFCRELISMLNLQFVINPDAGCGKKERKKLYANAAWVNITGAAVGDVETASALALGETQFKEMCIARDKGIHKWWKNKLASVTNSKKRKAAAEVSRESGNGVVL
jgi:hypothetical protein